MIYLSTITFLFLSDMRIQSIENQKDIAVFEIVKHNKNNVAFIPIDIDGPE